MAVAAFQSLSEHRYQCDVICSVPAGGAGERMTAYGCNFGRGTARTFSRLDGKTLLITDLTATNVAQKEIKFKRSDFANGNAPTLAEIVAAINAVLSVDATPTAASAGPPRRCSIPARAPADRAPGTTTG